MLLPVSNINTKVNFNAKDDKDSKEGKKLPYADDTLLKNNFSTRTRIGFDKLTNAFTVYPVKGLKGDRNANFYEFLTMGTVPYLIGSGMLMSVFNSANKYFNPNSKMVASAIGQKMALGVLLYGILKGVSKSLVTAPVKWLTGVDTELPYAKVNYGLPNNVNDTDITSIEYHKVFESKEFPRWDLLYGHESKGEVRNAYFDKIAKKLGLGTNLKDSDQEAKPIIKEVAVKTDMAKILSSYMWAATGVCLAFQQPWENYFKIMTLKFWKKDKFVQSLRVLKDSFCDSAKELWHGPKDAKGIAKHAGKGMVGLAVLSSVLGVANAVIPAKHKANLRSSHVMDKDRKIEVM